tara:strand:- start:207 stop:443 length:237 start_codon:yes stop_codon:yes gene_type:complete
MSNNRININGVDREMTAEEIAQKELDASNEVKRQTAEDEAKAKAKADKEANDTLKASAKAKLIAGEALTEDEANTIVL